MVSAVLVLTYILVWSILVYILVWSILCMFIFWCGLFYVCFCLYFCKAILYFYFGKGYSSIHVRMKNYLTWGEKFGPLFDKRFLSLPHFVTLLCCAPSLFSWSEVLVKFPPSKNSLKPGEEHNKAYTRFE